MADFVVARLGPLGDFERDPEPGHERRGRLSGLRSYRGGAYRIVYETREGGRRGRIPTAARLWHQAARVASEQHVRSLQLRLAETAADLAATAEGQSPPSRPTTSGPRRRAGLTPQGEASRPLHAVLCTPSSRLGDAVSVPSAAPSDAPATTAGARAAEEALQ